MKQDSFSTRDDALKVLGLASDADDALCKKTYRVICKKCHPDNTNDKKLNDYYILATKAYEYLETHPYIAPDVKPIRSTKIIGGGSAYKYNHDDYRKQQKKHDEKKIIQKQNELEQLREKANKLREEERRSKEKELLDAIRWLRVADIIHRTIEEDKRNMKDTE